MKKTIRELFDFIEASPTSYNAVNTVSMMLENMGCVNLSECEKWNLVPGGKYYVTRNNSSVIAFSLPESGFGPLKIIASHCDSPIFKLKTNFEQSPGEEYVKINTERYGGMIMSTWFDRPLSVAGRLIISDGCGVKTEIVDLKDPVLVIPNMPIHFNRNINDGFAYNAQVDTIPIAGSGCVKGKLLKAAADACGAKAEDIVGFDLFVYCAQKSTVTGIDGEYILSPRLDDLECAFSSLKAFGNAKKSSGINICCIFDNEEVGSGTKQGADSSFLTDILDRITFVMGKTAEEKASAVASGFMLSADNAHAVHPNHPEKYDGDNRVYMNKGVVIKFNANQKYTSDGISSGIFRLICEASSVPVQYFANRSDVVGGSTLGNISNSHLSSNTVDIGLAQLAMHSAVETAGAEDVDLMIKAMTAFYDSEIICRKDGSYVVK